MGYATLADLQQLTPRRRYTGSSVITASAAIAHLERTSAIIDGILTGRGYLLPVPTTATSVLEQLREANSVAAWARVEAADPAANQADRARSEWADRRSWLTTGTLELDTERQTDQGRSRSGTFANGTGTFYMDLDL